MPYRRTLVLALTAAIAGCSVTVEQGNSGGQRAGDDEAWRTVPAPADTESAAEDDAKDDHDHDHDQQLSSGNTLWEYIEVSGAGERLPRQVEPDNFQLFFQR